MTFTNILVVNDSHSHIPATSASQQQRQAAADLTKQSQS